eukprot:TRINITY_DN6073_c0_g1_i1.p1 TRINITY_DN6073_c0_g1~~TRINITY_DN6073_c0_g1_i1.p1  ORF type:complete len:162 (+),score=22.68 TRINITY_DN6073_c0_g1_i1:45-530(+)
MRNAVLDATVRGDAEGVRTALTAGGDPNSVDSSGSTALHHAASLSSLNRTKFPTWARAPDFRFAPIGGNRSVWCSESLDATAPGGARGARRAAEGVTPRRRRAALARRHGKLPCRLGGRTRAWPGGRRCTGGARALDAIHQFNISTSSTSHSEDIDFFVAP